MNEFQYNGTPQEQTMADLLKSQSHRLARQQIIFALIFLLVILPPSPPFTYFGEVLKRLKRIPC